MRAAAVGIDKTMKQLKTNRRVVAPSKFSSDVYRSKFERIETVIYIGIGIFQFRTPVFRYVVGMRSGTRCY